MLRDDWSGHLTATTRRALHRSCPNSAIELNSLR
jgi:hypothetical protein